MRDEPASGSSLIDVCVTALLGSGRQTSRVVLVGVSALDACPSRDGVIDLGTARLVSTSSVTTDVLDEEILAGLDHFGRPERGGQLMKTRSTRRGDSR